MRIAVVRETREHETRVALVPELVGRLLDLGHDVVVEPGAGRHALHPDAAYADAGAAVDDAALDGADLLLGVQAPRPDQVVRLADGAATLSFLPGAAETELVATLRDQGLTGFAVDLVPRTGRAQSMDALTSQSLVAGYRCAVVAAGMLRGFFPLTPTAAGTLPAARVLVLGAGVAGLEAIATARRLGAEVWAHDVRPASAEEIRSVGGLAVELDLEPLDEAAAQAREMSPERAARQRELLAPHVAAADALITTAVVPGRLAPLLVTRAMVEQMRPGAVVVDLAADSGGNVEGVEAGGVVRIGHAQAWGGRNVAAQLPAPASRLYAHNLVELVALMTVPGPSGGLLAPDFADDVVRACCVTYAGEIAHEPTRVAVERAGR